MLQLTTWQLFLLFKCMDGEIIIKIFHICSLIWLRCTIIIHQKNVIIWPASPAHIFQSFHLSVTLIHFKCSINESYINVNICYKKVFFLIDFYLYVPISPPIIPTSLTNGLSFSLLDSTHFQLCYKLHLISISARKMYSRWT